MTFPAALARWIDRLTGEAHSYACDYAAWWTEGGRQPVVAGYIERSEEDDAKPLSAVRAAEIAARIRQAVR